MGEYILFPPESPDMAFGHEFETNEQAIEYMERSIGGTLRGHREWTLHIIVRDGDPECNDQRDAIGPYHTSFVHHIFIDDRGKATKFDSTVWDETLSITLDEDETP